MKKILLFIILFVFLVNSAVASSVTKSADEYKPLVVEGRTWWYGDTHAFADSSKDYGMRIGKAVEMDGKQWNEVRVIKTIEHDSNWTTFFNPKEENILVALIREEDRKVYSRVLFKFNYDNVDNIRPEDYIEVLAYDFSNVDDEFTFCLTPHVVKFKISEIDKIENSGNEYTRWTASYQKQSDSDDYAVAYQTFQYAEQIGVTNPFVESEIFYCPFYLPATDGDVPPVLRYVTEGEDNTIIYEGVGGQKLWQVTESVDNVCVNNDTYAPVEYYDVHGHRIDRPVPGTVVIRRQGSVVTKLIVE